MFTYLNHSICEKLTEQGKLLRIDLQGNIVSEEAAASQNAVTIKLLGPIPLPISSNGIGYCAQWYAAVRTTELVKVEELATSMVVNSVLILGDLRSNNPLVRVHSNCLTGDVFGSQRCECGPQLAAAVKRISSESSGGMIVYMAGHEGRGIGLWAKAATYLLQDEGENTYQANESLGFPADSRDFTDAGALIWYFIGNRSFRLLTNNPKKIRDLEDCGLTEIAAERHLCGITELNKYYLSAKKRWGHHIEEDI